MNRSARQTKSGAFPRALAPAFAAALAALAASGAAEASSSTTISSSSGWTKSFSSSSWSTASSKVGTFGAGVTYTNTLSSDNTGNSKSSDNTADIDLELFGATFNLVGVEGKAATTSRTQTSLSQYLGATVGGYTLLSQTIWDTDTNSHSAAVQLGEVKYGGAKFNLSTTGSYAWTGFSICMEAAVSKDFVLVVVPVTIGGAVDACPTLAKTGSMWSTSSPYGLLYEVTPSVSFSLTLSAGVGNSDFSAGVFGSVDLLNFSTPMYSTMAFIPSTSSSGTLTYTSKGTETLSSLSGSFGVYATASYGIGSVSYQKTLASWDGITWASQVVYSDSVPAATSTQVTISGGIATGSYTYSEANGASESGSTYKWQRASSSSGSDGADISGATSKTYSVSPSDNAKYLRFCVTPKSTATSNNTGAEACSGWTSVGHLLVGYKDANYSNSWFTYAYEWGYTSDCYDISSFFNDQASSYQFYAPSNYSATLWLFKDANCSGSKTSQTVSAGNSSLVSSIGGTFGDSWQDKLSSVMVIWNETVSASDVSVSVSGNTATAEYTFEDTAGISESGSTYQWYRASFSNGGWAEAISGATSKTYTLTPSDNQQYLRVCVTPSTGYITGSQVCSDYSINAGDLLMLYKDSSYGGSSLALAYEKSASGTCFNLTDYSFNDLTSSFKWPVDWTGNYSGSSATLTFYKDTNCSGTSTSYSTNTHYYSSYVGDTWNDVVSSVKVTWSPTVSISKPTVTISGSTATQSHTYSDTAGETENSTYQWYRSGTASGSGTAISGATGSTYRLTGSDDNAYLKVCVTPANIATIGTTQCSDWTQVGYVVMFYSQQSTSSSSETAVYFAYQKSASGTCFNMSDYGFDDLARAFVLYSSTSSAATLTYYQAANCVSDSSQSEWALSVSTNGSGVVYNTTNAGYVSSGSGFAYAVDMGALFDNAVSSFKVTY